MKTTIHNLMKTTIVTILVTIFGGFLYYLLCLNHVSLNDVGVAYNSLDGTMTIQERPGWYRTSPFTLVADLSILPQRVSIPSEAVVINTKVVKLRPEGVPELIHRQGFSYMLDSSLNNILIGYAFSGKEYPFLEIVQEVTVDNFTGGAAK